MYNPNPAILPSPDLICSLPCFFPSNLHMAGSVLCSELTFGVLNSQDTFPVHQYRETTHSATHCHIILSILGKALIKQCLSFVVVVEGLFPLLDDKFHKRRYSASQIATVSCHLNSKDLVNIFKINIYIHLYVNIYLCIN